MHTAYAVKLTEQEKALLTKIDFALSTRSDGPENWRRVADAMQGLTRLLVERNAIPEARLKYVTDPECNVQGHGSSRKEIIERNDPPTPMVRNPAFVKYLHYFLYGPDLPSEVIEAFGEKVAACGKLFTGTDAMEVGDLALRLTRSNGLDPYQAPEEFQKLALECGLRVHHARSVRDRVMRARRR
jgi:hypothetical protein